MSEVKIQGSCLCGDVRYEINSQPKQINLCHCKMCQKFSGSAFGAFMWVPLKSFRYTKGEEQISFYNSSEWGGRKFCSQCGTSLEYVIKSNTELKFIAAGTLDSDPNLKSHHHIFTASKAEWYDIHSDIPEFEDWESSVSNNTMKL